MKQIYKDLRGITLLIVLGLGLFFTMKYTLPRQPLAGGNCSDNFIAKDESSPFTYSGNVAICRAIVKAGSVNQGEACFGFSFPPASQQNDCYKVSGLGSTNVKVTKIGGDECKDVSHVEFLACPTTPTQEVFPTFTPTGFLITETSTPENPTFTPTATGENPEPSASPTVSQTSTPTSPNGTPTSSPTFTPTIPFKFWTPTPTDTVTPEITITVTFTPEFTITSTPPGGSTPTTSSPPRNKPPEELPQTGIGEDLPLGLSLFLGLLLIIAVARMIRRFNV